MQAAILFSETQKFTKTWTIMLLPVFLFVNGIFLFAAIQQIGKGQPFGNHPMSDLKLIIVSLAVLLLSLAVLFLLAYSRLDTLLQKDGIYVRLFPFHFRYKKYAWEQISNAFVRKYNPVLEYGGWGMHFSKHGKSLSVSGNTGLQLEFLNGKKLLIGTNRGDEIAELLKQINLNKKEK